MAPQSHQTRIVKWVMALLGTAMWSGCCVAQNVAKLSDAEVSKESDNPVTQLITIPLRYEADFDNGPYKATKDTFSINQGVVPFLLTEDWALITRTKLPFVVQPPKKRGAHWEAGLSNGYTTFFLSPRYGNGFYWGAGPLLYYPASNAAVGVERWGSGPSVAVLKKDQGPLLLGAVVNNIWTFDGSGSDRTNKLLLNPIASYHFSNGWAVGSSPNITADWTAGGGKWTVPVGGNVSKVVRLGEQPLKLAVDAYYNAVRPKAGNDTWLLQFTVTLQFPP
jgi:hypothetical protein